MSAYARTYVPHGIFVVMKRLDAGVPVDAMPVAILPSSP
eukprot:CAMPEP_0119404382 /NCGR_PEP_ID=MMETSP1334-20130426/143868_1 /TAXON_ID=127549 /ORGANISM="Calcidiscus leptoporus, Strain RCC1130" /LENGTH=38 /DNA_ID= /DNA_START= /DNA_END= /DNA_ORIENTATION=